MDTIMAKYLGPIFTLLMTVGSFAMGVWFALNGHNGAAFCMAAMCAISGFVVQST